ncbi:MAG: UPF0182 family protein [Firmicutes bacterium]|nr:UPF0182 family protein [Bacillota bacterium]NLL88676.1 UPF0182 family protein [Bacillota bacterium]HKM17457.1 UPF0182 family protein [Limnochordia bacterium]
MVGRLKWVLLGLLVAAVVLVVAGSRLFTDWLWFRSLGYAALFTTRLTWIWGVRVGVWLCFSLILFINLWIVQKAARQALWRFYSLGQYLTGRRLLLAALLLSVILGFVYSAGYGGYYFEIAQFFNSTEFGVADPVFGKDIGFYFFRLPVYELLIGALTTALVLVAAVCATIYFLSGHFRIESRTIRVSTPAQKHLSLLIGILILAKAADYHLRAYRLLYNTHGIVFGAGYTDVNVRLAVLRVLTAVAVLVSLVFIARLYRFRRILAGALVLWVGISFVGGVLVPFLVQQWLVAPNEFTREQPFIEHHIRMTCLAYEVDDFLELDFAGTKDLTRADLEANKSTISNIRLWDPRLILHTYRQLQEMRPYYVFNDADVGRYWVDGEYREVLLAARELDVTLTQNRNWINDHLQYTHGYGVVVSPVNEVSRQQLPDFWVSDIPPKGKSDLKITEPRIYYGERSNDYVIVNTLIDEFDYPTGDGNAYYTYQGTGGVELATPLHRLAFAVRFGTMRILLSTDITSESRILFYRNIRARIQRLAPFLRYDQDPYIVIGDDGRLYWMVDAYTTSYRYPYAQPTSWGNYIRNSVKVVIDAYNGSVDFYQVCPDPVLDTYAKIFPGWLKALNEMPQMLRAHLRYPEDLFALQAEIYGTYHMTDPRIFYNREDVWVFANEIYNEREQPVVPYYVMMQLPNSSTPELILMLPYTPIRRNNLIAWLAARNDGEHYGEVLVYRFPKDSLTLGPAQIDATIDQDSQISQLLSLWGQRGSQVIRGNMLVLPINESLVYVEPLFLQSEQSGMPQLQRIIVAYKDQLVMEESLTEALNQIIDRDVGEPGLEEPETGLPVDSQVGQYAYELYEKAMQALRDGDFAGFGEALSQLESVLRRLIDE